MFEKIEPTPLRLNPLYIKVQFKRLKFSYKDKSLTFCCSGIPHLHELHNPRHHSLHHTHRHEHQYLQEGESTNCYAPNMTAWLDNEFFLLGKWCKSLVVIIKKCRQSYNIILLRPASRPRHGSFECSVTFACMIIGKYEEKTTQKYK